MIWALWIATAVVAVVWLVCAHQLIRQMRNEIDTLREESRNMIGSFNEYVTALQQAKDELQQQKTLVNWYEERCGRVRELIQQLSDSEHLGYIDEGSTPAARPEALPPRSVPDST